MRNTFLVLTVFVLLLTGCKPLVDQMVEPESEGSSSMEAKMDDDKNMNDNDMDKGDSKAMGNGYEEFDSAVLADGETKVIFFHAAWCPSCVAKDKDLKAWYGSEQVPLKTYKADFDAETDLKARYGVVMQDTFVVVDGSGNAVASLAEPSSGALKRVLYGNMDKAMEDKEEAMIDKSSEAMADKSQYSSEAMVKSAGSFTAYRDGVIGNGQMSVLFFHAQWCPKCKANEAKLNDWYSSEQFPRSIYLVDYDTAASLKTQYGIVQQDTFVLIDGDGNEVSRVSFPSETALRDLLG